MTVKADLDRVIALRALRENRAERAVMSARARLDRAHAATAHATDAIARHDAEEAASDAAAHDAMLAGRFDRADLDASNARVQLASAVRDVLDLARTTAQTAVDAAKAEAQARAHEWQQATRARMKLQGVAHELGQIARRRTDALAEVEADDTPRPAGRHRI